MNNDTLIYQVDHSDTIVSVNASWNVFADANACESFRPLEDVVGHKLWDFIEGRETRHLYQEIFRQVRGGKRFHPIPFRCDSPSERRFLELLVEALKDGQIQITSKTLKTEPRDPVPLLEADRPRSAEFLTMCSICKKIELSPGRWIEIEEALVHLRLFEADEMPQLTHGLCLPCYQTALRELN